jgi:hypothetical protein
LKPKQKQIEFDFYKIETAVIVQNCWAKKYHIQKVSGHAIDMADMPMFFDSVDAAAMYADDNGINVVIHVSQFD